MNKKGPSPRAKAPERVAVKVIEASSAAEDAALELEAPAALLPKLRFPEFREVEGWQTKEVGNICEILNNRRRPITGSERQPGPYPYYGASGIVDFVSDFIFDERLLLVGEDGAKWGAFERTAFIADKKYWVNNHAHVLKPFAILDTLLENYLTMTDLGPFVTGAAPPKLTLGKLKGIPVPVPTFTAEQQRIADCLSSLDELIAAQGRKLDALKTHKSGLMQQLFPSEGETVPSLRFPEFQDAGEWEENELGPKTNKVGSGITPSGGDKNYKLSGRPFVRSQNVGWGMLLLDDIAYIDEQTHASFDATEIKTRDVLLNITGASIGRSAVADDRIAGGNVNQHVCIIRTKPAELDPLFLNQFLISQRGQKQIDSFQAGGNRQGLNFAQIRSFAVPVPPTLQEQLRIAKCLFSLDELIAAQGRKLAMLKTHKKGLMQQLFPTMEQS
jgi:type I restriction enzyme S subunit